MDYDYCIKTILVGDSSVGKSSLLYRYTDNDWNPYYVATIGVDFKVMTFEREGKVVKLQLWDSAGQERFRSITQSYYRNAHAVAVVYDVTDRESFENIRTWMGDVRTFGSESVPCILIANKCDLLDKRVISPEEGKALAEQHGVAYFEASARTGAGVVEAFGSIIDRCVQFRHHMTGRDRKNILRLPAANEKKKTKDPSGRCFCN